jgi:hypothetical protein
MILIGGPVRAHHQDGHADEKPHNARKADCGQNNLDHVR